MKPCIFIQKGRSAEVFCRSNHLYEISSLNQRKCPYCGNRLKRKKEKYKRKAYKP